MERQLTHYSADGNCRCSGDYQSRYIKNHPSSSYRSIQNASSDNPLLRAASRLITLMTQIRHTVEHNHVAALRAQIIDEIRKFEGVLTAVQYPLRFITASRYCLCAALDEAVLSQSWGTKSVWIQGSLLSFFHKETWGGERVYIILEHMLKEGRRCIDFVELIYFLLSLGFEGKFFGEKNRPAREEIKNRVFYCIRHMKAKPEKNLSAPRKENDWTAFVATHKHKMKKMIRFTLLFFLIISAFFNYKAYRASEPVLKELNRTAIISPVTVFSQIVHRGI